MSTVTTARFDVYRVDGEAVSREDELDTGQPGVIVLIPKSATWGDVTRALFALLDRWPHERLS